MTNFRPVCDLRNYGDVLGDVEEGIPVFHMRNGRGRYMIMDMQDYEKRQAGIRLLDDLAMGRRSGEEYGWLDLDTVEKKLGCAANGVRPKKPK